MPIRKTDDPVAPKKPAKKAAPRRKKSGPAPYILTIMLLVAIILVLAVNIINRKPGAPSSSEVPVAATDTGKDTPRKPDKDKQDEKTAAASGDDASKNDAKKDIAHQTSVYFVSINDVTGKASYIKAARTVAGSDDIAGALRQLVTGMNAAERRKGYLSAFPDRVKINGVRVRGDIAVIDASPEIGRDAHGDIASIRINQLYYTCVQFSGVKGIEITVGGRPLRTLEPDGIILHWPLRKPL